MAEGVYNKNRGEQMVFVINPYNEKAKKRQDKFINFDESFQEWFNFSFKKYINLLIPRSIAIILVLFFLVQLITPVFRSFSVSAQGKLAANNSLDHVVISPDSASIQVGEIQAYTVYSYDQYNNLITNGLTYDWSATTGGTMDDKTIQSPIYTAGHTTGDFKMDVTVTQGTISRQVEAIVQITEDHFVFNIISSPQTAGTPFSITITAQNQYNNTDTNFTGICGLTDLTGTISPSTTPNFVAGQWTGDVIITQVMLADKITATRTGSTEKGISNVFDINHAKPVSIIIAPRLTSITAGENITYTSEATDLYGNLWDVTSATIFSIIEEGHNGVWNDNNDNIYTTHTSGKWTVQGVYSSFVDKVILNIVHTKAKSIEIIPRNYTTNSGQIINYNSKAKDKYNNFWESTLDTKFTISSEARGSWNANVYKSDKVGEWIVNGVYIPDPTITDTTFLDIKSKSIKSKSLSLSQQTQNIQGPIIPIGEVGIASSIGPIGSKPEVLAESIVRPLPGFIELLFPSKFFSAAGLASQSVADWTSNLSILFIILGALMLLASFLGWYDFLSLPDKAIKKR